VVNPLILKLRQYDSLSAAEELLLGKILGPVREVAAKQDLIAEGSRPTSSTLMLEGFSARCKTSQNGKRAITAIHIAGDFVDLHSFLIKKMDHSIQTLTPCVIAKVRHDDLLGMSEKHPHLARLFWLSTLTDAAIHRQQLAEMGAAPAIRHFAHFICEMYLRLAAVHRANDMRCVLPVTQEELADTLGLSAVHVNRTLQEIRALNFLTWEGKNIEITDWRGLQAFAEFDPTYLSYGPEPR